MLVFIPGNDTFKESSSAFEIDTRTVPPNSTISLVETGGLVKEVECSSAAKCQINHLKPCTDYQLSVAFINNNNNNSQIFCTETKRTRELSEYKNFLDTLFSV